MAPIDAPQRDPTSHPALPPARLAFFNCDLSAENAPLFRVIPNYSLTSAIPSDGLSFPAASALHRFLLCDLLTSGLGFFLLSHEAPDCES
jgi:hypothetical protein